MNKNKSKWELFWTWMEHAKTVVGILTFFVISISAIYGVLAYRTNVDQNSITNRNTELQRQAQEKAEEQRRTEQEKTIATQQVFNLAGSFAPYRAFLSRVNQLCEQGKDMTNEERVSSGLQFQFDIMMIFKQISKAYLLSNTSQANAVFGPDTIRKYTKEIFQQDRKVSTLFSEYCSNPRIYEEYVYGMQNILTGTLLMNINNNDFFIFKPEDIEAFKNPDFDIPDSIYNTD